MKIDRLSRKNSNFDKTNERTILWKNLWIVCISVYKNGYKTAADGCNLTNSQNIHNFFIFVNEGRKQKLSFWKTVDKHTDTW